MEDEVWRRASRTKWATQRGPFSTKTSMVKVQLSPAALILSHTWLSLTWLKPDYLANGFPFGSQSSMPTWSLYLILRVHRFHLHNEASNLSSCGSRQPPANTKRPRANICWLWNGMEKSLLSSLTVCLKIQYSPKEHPCLFLSY